jgi:hypothetical protein
VPVVLAVLVAACTGDDGGPAGATTEPGPQPAEVAASLCEATAVTDGPAAVQSEDVTELSGLVAGRRADDRWWAHNDSGNEARLYAIGPAGEDLGSVAVEGAANVDWEDLAAGPGPDGGLLYVADIGDNTGDRDSVLVEVIAEPDPTGGLPPAVAVERTIELTWPDGARDAEVLLVDAHTSELVIVTRSFAGASEVYVADGLAGAPVELERVGAVDLREAAAVPSLDAPLVARLGLGAATGGDTTEAGDAVILRTYGTVLVWPRRRGQTVAEAIVENDPCEAPSAFEPQGEAIAADPDGAGYRTISEGTRPPVNRFVARSP